MASCDFGRTFARLGALAGLLLLAACGNGEAQGGAGGPRRRAGPGRLCRHPAVQRPGRAIAARPGRGLPDFRGPAAGVRASSCAGCSPKARSSGRVRRSIRSIPASIRRRSSQAAANLQSARASAEAARARAERYRPLAEMEAVSKQDYTDALAQARQAECRDRPEQCRTADRPDQPALHPRAGADQRPDRPVERHRGRAGHRQPGGSAGHHHPARSDLCRHPAVGARPAGLRRSLSQGGAVRRPRRRCGCSCPTAATMAIPAPSSSPRWWSTPDTGSVTLRARFPNPQIDPAARHVRDGAASRRRSTPPPILVPQAAISRDPKGNATLWVVGPGNTAVPADRRRRSDRRRQLGRHAGPGGRRKGHHPGHRPTCATAPRSSRFRPARRSASRRRQPAPPARPSAGR